MSLKTKIENEVLDELDEVHKMDVGTDEYRVSIDGIEKMTKLSISMEREQFEREFKLKQLEADNEQKRIENELKRQQIEQERKSSLRNDVIQAVGIGLSTTIGTGLVLYGTWFEVLNNYPDMGTREIMKDMMRGIFHKKK